MRRLNVFQIAASPACRRDVQFLALPPVTLIPPPPPGAPCFSNGSIKPAVLKYLLMVV